MLILNTILQELLPKDEHSIKIMLTYLFRKLLKFLGTRMGMMGLKICCHLTDAIKETNKLKQNLIGNVIISICCLWKTIKFWDKFKFGFRFIFDDITIDRIKVFQQFYIRLKFNMTLGISIGDVNCISYQLLFLILLWFVKCLPSR